MHAVRRPRWGASVPILSQALPTTPKELRKSAGATLTRTNTFALTMDVVRACAGMHPEDVIEELARTITNGCSSRPPQALGTVPSEPLFWAPSPFKSGPKE